jgi:hypothetical protein
VKASTSTLRDGQGQEDSRGHPPLEQCLRPVDRPVLARSPITVGDGKQGDVGGHMHAIIRRLNVCVIDVDFIDGYDNHTRGSRGAGSARRPG